MSSTPRQQINLTRSALKSDQYWGPWAMVPDRFQAAIRQVRGMDLGAHIQAATDNAAPIDLSYEIVDGIALMAVHGAITKHGSSLSDAPGTVQLRRMLRNATQDDAVRAIMISMDSPGGTVAGVSDAADSIFAARQIKPVGVHAEDTLASAAYWLASQATRTWASPGTLVGSIGTYTILEDWSAAFESKGIKTIVVKAGENKAIGEGGMVVTDDQIAEVQRMVDDVNDLFLSAIVRGRDDLAAKDVAALNDGRIHVAKDAKRLGLIDAVADFDTAMRRLRSMIPRRTTTHAKVAML